jgi:hypothetical protein
MLSPFGFGFDDVTVMPSFCLAWARLGRYEAKLLASILTSAELGK